MGTTQGMGTSDTTGETASAQESIQETPKEDVDPPIGTLEKTSEIGQEDESSDTGQDETASKIQQQDVGPDVGTQRSTSASSEETASNPLSGPSTLEKGKAQSMGTSATASETSTTDSEQESIQETPKENVQPPIGTLEKTSEIGQEDEPSGPATTDETQQDDQSEDSLAPPFPL
jgi:hypothetical protein